jgi:hypothetical protein
MTAANGACVAVVLGLMYGSILLAQQPAPALAVPPAPMVTVLEDTAIRVRTIEPISSRQTRDGAQVAFNVDEDVRVGEQLAIPRGALVRGEVVRAKHAGTLTGTPELILKLTALEIDGKIYAIDSHLFQVMGASKTPQTEKKVATGATIGAVAGAAFTGVSARNGVITSSDKAASSAAGAVVGAGVGTIVAAATPGPVVTLPSESEVEFTLAVPVTLPVARPETIHKLNAAAPPGEPVLYVRGQEP